MEPSIWVKVGGFILLHITTFDEASAFLEDWDVGARNAFFYLASDAFEGLKEGSIPPEVARLAFETFCRDAGVLRDPP
ncbi:hypothetical protein [Aminobacter sp. MET-1]|uniref:hypothetical protein n=1 Tax=Aminobacter sp. MET-1 TaxID=2951085 RepID=UPI00226A0DCF|nr:hypothetical protein [Aminobacter sp. MET-1]MCX8570793.1 hypothetical protein [Aminobacter sp. MET-1]